MFLFSSTDLLSPFLKTLMFTSILLWLFFTFSSFISLIFYYFKKSYWKKNNKITNLLVISIRIISSTNVLLSTSCFPSSSVIFLCFFPWSPFVSFCLVDFFSKAFPRGEYANLACSISWLSLESNISLSVRYSY